jgi:hemerythrin superfamily protein
MKATELLKQQHRDVTKLFKAFEAEKSDAKQREIFEEVAAMLVAHDAIEREIFYPACERAMGMDDELGEALVEHGVIEFCLYEADEAQAKSSFTYKVKVLSEMVEHHVKEEEKEFFPKVEDAIEEDKLEELGMKMEERFDEARADDFRAPLHENLRQVLAGTIKPKPKKMPNGARRGADKRA